MVTGFDRLAEFLTEKQVPFEIQHHRQTFTTQAVAAELHEKGAHVAKVVIAWADHKLVMLVVAAPDHVDFDRVAGILRAANVRAAHEEEFKFRFPDCEPGAMPPFGNLYQMPTYVDRSLVRQSTLVIPAATHRDSLKLAMADYLRVAEPVIADFSLAAHLQPSAAH